MTFPAMSYLFTVAAEILMCDKSRPSPALRLVNTGLSTAKIPLPLNCVFGCHRPLWLCQHVTFCTLIAHPGANPSMVFIYFSKAAEEKFGKDCLINVKSASHHGFYHQSLWTVFWLGMSIGKLLEPCQDLLLLQVWHPLPHTHTHTLNSSQHTW